MDTVDSATQELRSSTRTDVSSRHGAQKGLNLVNSTPHTQSQWMPEEACMSETEEISESKCSITTGTSKPSTAMSVRGSRYALPQDRTNTFTVRTPISRAILTMVKFIKWS